MRKMIAFLLTAALLVLGGCSKLNPSAKAEVSCDMCHVTHLNKSAVHRMHLTNIAMSEFPIKDTSVAARMKVVSGTGDTTFKYMVDSTFKFSNSAAIDRAAHYKQTRLLNYGINCVDCHNGLDKDFVLNSDPDHRNGVKAPSFDEEMLRAMHYNSTDTAHFKASVPAMTFNGTGCDNISCHGAGRKDILKIVWNTSAKLGDTLSCLGCHDTRQHKVGVTCEKCHYDVTLDNGKTIHNFRKHLNDTINYGRY